MARKAALPDLRERSRQNYLQSREEQQLLLLEQRIRDEEFLFEKVELSRAERERLEYDRKVLQLAKERMQVDDRIVGYKMPEGSISS